MSTYEPSFYTSQGSYAPHNRGNQDFHWEEGKGLLGKLQQHAPLPEGHCCLLLCKFQAGGLSRHSLYWQEHCRHSAVGWTDNPMTPRLSPPGSVPGKTFIFQNIITHNLTFKIHHPSPLCRCSYVLTCWVGTCAEGEERPPLPGGTRNTTLTTLILIVKLLRSVWALEIDLFTQFTMINTTSSWLSSFYFVNPDHVHLIFIGKTFF